MDSPTVQWHKVSSDDYFSVDEKGKTIVERLHLTVEGCGALVLEEGLSTEVLRVNAIRHKILEVLVKDIVDSSEVATTAYLAFVSEKFSYITVTGEF